MYAYVQQNPWSKFDAEGLFLSALVTAGFAAYDTYQYATGKISGADYAGRMALNGAALVADAASGGMGGGLAVRMTATGSRAVTTVIKTAKAVDKANDFVENVQTAVETGQSIVEASEGEGRGLVRAAANALEDAATKKVLGSVAGNGALKRTKQGGALTEPNLPPKTIVKDGKVEIVHYTRSGDHGPAHLHVKGGGDETKVGQAGKPIDGSPELTPTQSRVVKEHKKEIRKSVDQIQRWKKFEDAEG